MVMISPPETFSVAPCCDELASTEKSSAASNACKSSETRKLPVNRSG